MSKKLEFEVDMMCNGCATAVRGVVGRVPGVEKLDVSWENNQVIVDGTADADTILAVIKRTGKTCSFKGEVSE